MGRVNVVLGGSGGLSSAKPPPTHIRWQAPAFAIRDKLSRMPPYPVPQAAITVNPETGQFGFKVWFAGKKPHYVMAGAFTTKKDALEFLDPHSERVWDAPQGDDAQSWRSLRDSKRVAFQRGSKEAGGRRTAATRQAAPNSTQGRKTQGGRFCTLATLVSLRAMRACDPYRRLGLET